MQRRTLAALLALIAFLAVGLGACGDDDDDGAGQTTETTAEEAEGSDSISIKYVDYAYEVSGALTAGGTIELENAGKEMHMIAAGKLKAGKTLDDWKTAIESSGDGGGGGGGEEGGGEGGGEGEDSPTVETTRASRSQSQTTTTAAEGEEGGEEGGGGEEEDPLAEVADEVFLPGNLMGPGAKVAVTVPGLEPGTYGIACFLPTEGEGEPHFSKGMINVFEVVEGEVAEPTADATYKIAAGEAPDGPATLTPGEKTLKFEATGSGSGELEPALVKLDPGATFETIDKQFVDLFEGEDPPPKGAAEQIKGEVTWIGFDFGEDGSSYYLSVDLEPGTYLLVAEDTDDDEEGDTARPKELLEIKVA
jgi:hypothetical protein